ncbi:hypothetical protein DCS_01759 [Drechmeria coniospora]|uniref:Endoplasmic reticulum-Golgi intermediate compartment protein n=1 Tax=Drechmeria coniospora TaxID=98403 RepID=A0A151GU70_DRECN|nr:hypothetical protein DCS_01759 [Drechmeria coniospora]KYK60621.1 hypothetical protein DCS_01759 [Drechmeria coniospora]ODA80778.1 hypothetical protein RJ55_03737 [Drechmeria coniospora]
MSSNEKLDKGNFGAKGSIVKAFDAFPKSKPQYVLRTAGGGKWTVAMAVISLLLFGSEVARWWRGSESHTFAVEKGISQSMQINLDAVVKMACGDLDVNVQDASGDRILAATRLQLDQTSWSQWANAKGVHQLGLDKEGRIITGAGWHAQHDEGFGEEHIHDIVALGKKKAKWAKTPTVRGPPDSCRIFGSLELNKVQGDFHITARGHGYIEAGKHLDHNMFNFSHIISELSFGPFYPSLVNPLDRTVHHAGFNFYKFQYFLSVVPTVYSVGSSSIATNQYAVTEQSKPVNERTIPGIFVKYDIEPVLLSIRESRDGIFVFLVKLINVLSGVLVASHWGYTLTDWVKEIFNRKTRRASTIDGVLGTADDEDDDE